MFENTSCQECVLHQRAKHVCLPSQGGPDCKLAIYLDSPTYMDDKRGRSFVSDNAEFVKYCLRRMSVNVEDVYFDYIVKCYPGKLPGKKKDRMACVRACSQYRFASLQALKNLQSIVVLGAVGCEAITLNKTIGEKAGAEWEPVSPLMRELVKEVWVGFSPGLLAEKPAEAGSIYRVIWSAAEEAGLNPKTANIKPYEFVI